jgi:hypothetical protein
MPAAPCVRCSRCGGPLPTHYPPCRAGIGVTRAPSTPPPLAVDEPREPPVLTPAIIEKALQQALPGARELHKLLEPLSQLTPEQASLRLW